MPAVVVDSVVLIDFRDASATGRHRRAQDIVSGVDEGDLPTAHVTDYVLLETLNWLHGRGTSGLATDTYERLHASAGFELVHAPQKDLDAAVELFQRYDGLSFGDATTVAYMHREGLEYVYSFDDDFDAVEGVTRLTAAENPFGG